MSFIWFAARPLRTREQVALEVHQVSLARGLDALATVICLMGISTEVGADDDNGDRQWWCPWNAADPASKNYPYDSQSNDGLSVGYLQQQQPWWGGTASEMTLSSAANLFLSRLADDYTTAANNPALAGQFAQRVQGSAFPDRYAEKWDEAWDVFNRAVGTPPPSPTPAPAPGDAPAPEPTQPPQEAPVANRPDFNEFANPSTNFEGRQNTKVDLFILHTQEPETDDDNAALALSNFLKSTEGTDNPRSYHFTIRQASDGGVTVVDVVSPDFAAWAVGASNYRSINLCFAGTGVAESRDEWMKQSKAIDVAAFIAVRECRKYGIPLNVLCPDYAPPGGIADHRYCGAFLHDGNNHDDVGDHFPWDYFTERVAFWAADAEPAPAPAPAPAPEPAPVPVPQPTPPPPAEDQFQAWVKSQSDRQLIEWIVNQLGDGDPSWPTKGSTLRDKVWSLHA